MKIKYIVTALIISGCLVSCKKEKTNPPIKLDTSFQVLHFVWPRFPETIDSFKVELTVPLNYQDGKYSGTTITQKNTFPGTVGEFNFMVDRTTYTYIAWKSTIYLSNGTSQNLSGVSEKIFFGSIAGYSIRF